MDLRVGIGKTGVALAILIAIAMCILSLLFHPVADISIQYGLCLPSPDSWNIDRTLSWSLNTLLIGIIALLLWLINRTYNFIRTTEPLLPVIFLILASSSPWFTQILNTSTILCLANVVCMAIIFAYYDTPNATQPMFIMGGIAGLGSMFQYAFLPMACVFFLWALFMKVLRFKEMMAFIIGILCPYWIAIGIGWIRISDMHLPSLMPLFNNTQDKGDLFFLLIGITAAAGVGTFVALANSIKLYAGNSKVNAMNLCISVVGAASILCILVDFDNMPAYVLTLYMAFAVQLANISALWKPKMPWLVMVLPSVLYIVLFIGTILI